MNQVNQPKKINNLSILKEINDLPKVKYLFCDFFDTLVHRNTHPNYSFKLWAKHMIRELGMFKSAHELAEIRLQSMSFIGKKNNRRLVEIPYDEIIIEIHTRLLTTNLITSNISFDYFLQLSKKADFRAEIAVQFLNYKLIEELRVLKNSGYILYLISDFYLPEEVMRKLMEHHGFGDLFSKNYISCSVESSKEDGNIYPYVLNDTNVTSEEVVMIGDNRHSDVTKAHKHGILSIYLKHRKHKFRNKLNLFGSDKLFFNKVVKTIEQNCKKSNYPYSEYIVFFTVFTERLYKEAKKKGIKNLFFLAREGAYLKKLFDAYQDKMNLSGDKIINTHYLKASRQSAMQIALKELHLENFSYLEHKYGAMSATTFMQSFLFNDGLIKDITAQAGIEKDIEYANFVSSPDMVKLKQSLLFKKAYEEHRISQKQYFNSYINSFKVPFEKEGITVVDVGWGGSMQEWLFQFFDGKVKVEGYYLGLKEIYNITKNTKRWGLNFTVHPEIKYADTLLMANSQLYEQLLSASHGSTLAYCSSDKGFTIEFHQKNEKWAYDNLLMEHQEFMFSQFKILLNLLEPICYEYLAVQKSMTDLTLRLGLFQKTKHLIFFKNLSQSFYQNIGNNQIGLTYSPSKIRVSKSILIINFLVFPEKIFKYLVKLNPFIFSKKGTFVCWLMTPLMYLTYLHIKNNKYLRTKLLDKVNI